jgi:hypothetical protein
VWKRFGRTFIQGLFNEAQTLRSASTP